MPEEEVIDQVINDRSDNHINQNQLCRVLLSLVIFSHT